MVALNVIIQGTKETLNGYVERLTFEGVEVYGTYVILKCFIFENNLCDNYKFKEELGLWVVRDLIDLLVHAHPYINYKEKKLAEKVVKRTHWWKTLWRLRQKKARATTFDSLTTYRWTLPDSESSKNLWIRSSRKST